MPKTELGTVLADLVGCVLPRGGSTKTHEPTDYHKVASTGLYVLVRLTVSHFPEDGDEIRRTATVHFVFERPSNYTKVWVAVRNRPGQPEPADYIMRADHDSCWRDDGFRDLHAAEVDLHRALVALVKPDPGCGLDLHEHHVIQNVQRCKITYEPTSRVNGNYYFKTLTSMKLTGPRLNNQ